MAQAAQTWGGGDLNNILANNNELISTAARGAANSPPSGSVPRSFNTDPEGVTTDSVETSFGNGNLGMTITRQDGGEIAFNTADDMIRSSDQDMDEGYFEREWTVFKQDNSSATTAEVIAFWNVSDPTDYLAAGYWLHFDGDVGSLNFDQAGVGAFVDGPDLDGTPTIPEAGSASYEGEARGLFAYRYGSGSSAPERRISFGEYVADAQLSANFDSRTVDGCIGCGDRPSFSGLLVYHDGRTREREEVPIPVEVGLASAPIRSDGTFVSTGIDIRTDLRIDRSNGSWGGKFSTVQLGDAPRLVAGTIGVNWTESDGSSGSLVGAFFAGQE